MSHRIYTLSLELYDSSPAHLVRYGFEVLLAAAIALLVLLQLWDMGRAACSARGRRRGGLLSYLASGGAWLKLASNGLLLLGVLLWWTFVTRHAKTFAMAPRYNVRRRCGEGAAAEARCACRHACHRHLTCSSCSAWHPHARTLRAPAAAPASAAGVC